MESPRPRRDGENKLAKTIKEQNLKFSVEFENGKTAGHKDSETNGNNTYTNRESENIVQKTTTTTTTTTTKKTTTTTTKDGQTVKTENEEVEEKKHQSRREASKRKVDDSNKENPNLKLPPISDSRASPRESKSFSNPRK